MFCSRQEEQAGNLAEVLCNPYRIEEIVIDREKQIDIENRLLRTLVDSDIQRQAYMNQVLRLAKAKKEETKDAD